MELDKTTYYDLSIFNRDEEYSLFHRLDFTTTAGGREYLRQLFSTPLQNIAAIQQRQDALRYILEKEAAWPEIITNGTIVVVENYLEAQISPISNTSGPGLLFNAVITKTIYAPDYGFIKFSFTQLLNLVKGFRSLVQTFNTDQTPKILKQILDRAQQLLHQREFSELLQITDPEKLSFVQILRHDHFIRNRQKKQLWELLDLYKKLDAYYAMAKAIRQF